MIRTAVELDLPCVLAGSGPDEPRLRALAAEASVPVTFVPKPSDRLLYSLYRRCATYVFPAVEDFGLMPVEALAAGAPIVVGPVGGAREIVGDTKAGVIAESTRPATSPRPSASRWDWTASSAGPARRTSPRRPSRNGCTPGWRGPMSARNVRKVYVNCAFVHQRVTGQQRYAHEITARLPADWHRVAPGGIWAQSPALTWLWTLFALPWITRRGVLLSLTSRAPLWHPRHVLTVHDLFVLEHPEWYSASYVRTHAPLLRWQLRTARRLVAVSEPVAEQIVGTLGRRPAVAPNASSAVFEDSEAWDHDAPTRRGLGSGRYFVVVGNQEPRKNLATLAAAYARLSQAERSAWPLVVVGGSAGIYRESAIDWPEGTQLAGYVSDPELAGLYFWSGGVLLASLAEGFGLPLVEAAAAGAARLVVSDIPVFRWICGDDATYVPPTDVDAWTAAMRRVMRGDLPRCSPTLAKAFSWDAAGETITGLVGTLGGGGRDGPGARVGESGRSRSPWWSRPRGGPRSRASCSPTCAARPTRTT